jgi:nicotinate-nucleotide adenylyltransferase
MLRLALQGEKRFEISDYELLKKTTGYSVDLMAYFKKIYPEEKLFFIIGADSFRDLPKWRRYERLMALCEFIVVSRPGYNGERFLENFSGAETPPKALFLKDVRVNASSSQLREALEKGLYEAVKLEIPGRTLEYIMKNKLYLNP